MNFFLKTLKLIMLLVFIALAPTSCDYIIEKNDSDYEISSNAKTKINIYKREAKLLLKASKNNLDILELCETIINVDTQNSVSYLTSKLEKVHFEISKNYDDIANDKLISIPRYTKIDAMFKEIKGVEQATFIESNLKLILNKTEAQIQLLDTLGNVTDNIDFKILVIKGTQKLKSNIDKIENTLNRLNKRVQALATKNYYHDTYKHNIRHRET